MIPYADVFMIHKRIEHKNPTTIPCIFGAHSDALMQYNPNDEASNPCTTHRKQKNQIKT